MHAQYELTKRFSAEFSIRPFLVRYPDATYARLEAWSKDANVHVRRLVSEGTRPRLPWAPRLRAFQDDPQPVLALLERLKDDSERYVQRSVANSLNDIAKDHPDLVTDVCRRWMSDATPGRAWIVKHALRSLVKKGEQGALSIIGASGAPSVAVDLIALEPREVKLGGELRFAISITSTMKQSQNLVVDYVVHFAKASGETRPKVFKLRRIELGAMDRIELRGAVSFAKMTTRRHYTGRHGLDAMIRPSVRLATPPMMGWAREAGWETEPPTPNVASRVPAGPARNNSNFAVALAAPPLPVTVMSVRLPGVALVVLRVIVADKAPASIVGESAVTPAGNPVTLRRTGSVKPARRTTMTSTVPVCGTRASRRGSAIEIVKSPPIPESVSNFSTSPQAQRNRQRRWRDVVRLIEDHSTEAPLQYEDDV